MKNTIKCPCGKDSKYSTSGGISYGDFMKKTGWSPLPLYDGSSLYLCKECAKEAVSQGERLIELVGSVYCVIPSLRGKYINKKE